MKRESAAYPPIVRPLIATAAILMLPLVAMQFSEDVRWSLSDFAIMGALILGVGVLYEVASRSARHPAFRAGAAVALLSAFLLIWVNGAVGIVGDGDNLANRLYLGALGVGALGAVLARFRPHGLALSLYATAAAVTLAGGIALLFRVGGVEPRPVQVLLLTEVFAVLFLGSAALFQEAAGGSGLVHRLSTETPGSGAYRGAFGIALAAALLLMGSISRVGLIGDPENVANAIYAIVLAIPPLGALVVRFASKGMTRVMFATAATIAVVGSIALAFRLGAPAGGPGDVLLPTAIFGTLFAGSALLFRAAAREGSDRGTA